MKEFTRYAILQNMIIVRYVGVSLVSGGRRTKFIKLIHGGSHDRTNIKQMRKTILVVLRHFRTLVCSFRELISTLAVDCFDRLLVCLEIFLSTCPLAGVWEVDILPIL